MPKSPFRINPTNAEEEVQHAQLSGKYLVLASAKFAANKTIASYLKEYRYAPDNFYIVNDGANNISLVYIAYVKEKADGTKWIYFMVGYDANPKIFDILDKIKYPEVYTM